MASITITIAASDVADVFAAYTQNYKADAVRLFFANDEAAYNAATSQQRGEALIKAEIILTVRAYRRAQALLAAANAGVEPAVT